MTTQNSLFRIEEEEDGIVILHYKLRDETQQGAVPLKQRLVTWIGTLVTIAWGAAAFAPAALHISAAAHPWIFLTFVFWFFAFCGGVFNS